MVPAAHRGTKICGISLEKFLPHPYFQPHQGAAMALMFVDELTTTSAT